jgi:DNA-binding NarL/FixJ family response regulator
MPTGRRPAAPGESQTTVRSRIVLADSADLVRAGLRAALELDSHVAIVREARHIREAFEAMQRLQVDLLVVDVELPGFNGLDTLQYLKQACPKTNVLLLGSQAASDFVYEALAAGAAGYLLKTASLSKVQWAVRQALRGEVSVEDHGARQVFRRVVDKRAPRPLLSPREIQVIECVARGYTNRQIAEELVITPHTVKVHVEHILDKLDVQDRTHAAVRAVELGFVRSDKRVA